MLGGLDASGMRSRNSSLVLKMLWHEREMSRAALSRRTGLSRASISAIINEYIEMGLVSELGQGESNGGRPPVMLCFEENAYLLAGLDMGASHISLCLTNLRGEVKEWISRDCRTREKPLETIGLSLDMLREASLLARRRGRKLLGLGVGVSSPILKIGQERTIHPAIHPKWSGLVLSEILRQHTSLPVFVDNDANLGALAEYWWREPAAPENLIYLKVATGVGAGLIVDGELIRGSHGIAGELGHTLFDNRPETATVERNLNRHIGFDFLLQGQPIAFDGSFPDAITRGGIVKRLIESPAGQTELKARILDHLIPAMINLILTLDPDMIIIGGEFPRLGEELLEEIRALVAKQLIWPELQHIPIEYCRSSDQQTSIGAATLVLDHVLNDLSLFKDAKSRRLKIRSFEPEPSVTV